MNYIYIFNDGTYGVSKVAPTEGDKAAIDLGELTVLITTGGVHEHDMHEPRQASVSGIHYPEPTE